MDIAEDTKNVQRFAGNRSDTLIRENFFFVCFHEKVFWTIESTTIGGEK